MRHVLAGLCFCLACGVLLAEAPPLVNFQGKLTDSGGVPVADGSHSLRFRVYSAATGDTGDPCAGSCLWEETQNLSTQFGVYSVLLGSVTPLTASVFDGSERYVSVKLAAEPEMTPRQRIASVPYALSAGVSQTANGQVTVPFTAGEAISAGDAVSIWNRQDALNGQSLDLEASANQFLRRTGVGLTGDLTIEAWIKPESLAGGGEEFTFAGKWKQNTNERSYKFANANFGKLSFSVSDDGTTGIGHKLTFQTDAIVLTVGIWYHVAATFDIDAETCTFYVNGSPVASSLVGGTTMGPVLDQNSAEFRVGAIVQSAGNDAEFYDGLIDEVRVWSVARTAVSIAESYEVSVTGTESDLVGYWKLEGGFADETSNGNDLSGFNAPSFSSDVVELLMEGATTIVKADASSPANSQAFIGFAQTSATQGGEVNVIVSGIATGISNVSPNAHHYLTNTSGVISTSPGTNVKKVGVGISSSSILITNIW